jgi:GMP synthase-like glutamine amidotransferase
MIAIAPSHKNQLDNYTNWLRKRNLPFVILKEGDSVSSCSMLLLCGGPDVGSVPERDERELRWFKESYGRIPVLGVCRGLQISNVILGGKLHEDLSAEKVTHTSSVNEIAGEPNKTLESSWHHVMLHDGRKIRVNSRHHQGISELATGLKPLAWCEEDQLLEMVEGDRSLFVQWHPEREEVWGTEAEQVVYDWIAAHYASDSTIDKIRSYTQAKGFTVISYDRIRKSIDSTMDDASIDLLVESNIHSMKKVKDKHGRKAIKVLS